MDKKEEPERWETVGSWEEYEDALGTGTGLLSLPDPLSSVLMLAQALLFRLRAER